jgi:Tfp pilus assembly protein PilO
MSNKVEGSSGKLVLRGGYGALILGFLLAGVFPIVRDVRSARADIQRLESEVVARNGKQRELESIRKSVVELSLETTALDRLLPRNQDLGSFLRDMTTQFGEAGMKDISYHNLPPTPLGRSQRLPIEVKGRGTYAQFHDFLERLEKLPRLCSVGRLSIEADADMAGGIEVHLTLFIYNSKPTTKP